MKSIDKLRESSHLDDNKWTLETGEVVNVFGSEPSDPNAVNWGKQWRKIADEIEAEIADNYMRLPVDADGVPIHVGDVMMDGKTPRYAVAVAPESFMMDGYENGSFYRPGLAKNHHHVKPRTLEDVLRDVWNEAINYMESSIWRNPDEVFAERADEIRELMGVEGESDET